MGREALARLQKEFSCQLLRVARAGCLLVAFWQTMPGVPAGTLAPQYARLMLSGRHRFERVAVVAGVDLAGR